MRLVQFFGGSDKGLVRSENEDSFLTYIPGEEAALQKKGALAIVADGVGGSSGGKEASRMAVEIIKEYYYDLNYSLKESLQAANSRIHEKAQKEGKMSYPATTCTAFVVKDEEGFISHVGDSRAYLFREGKLMQITEDHTLVGKMVSEGFITAEEARVHPQRNVILKALGGSANIEPEGYFVHIEEGDSFILCSDGLHGLVEDFEIEDILKHSSQQNAVTSLINLANERGGFDNITVVIVSSSDAKGASASWIKQSKKTLLMGLAACLIAIAAFFMYKSEIESTRATPHGFGNTITIK